MVQIPYRFFREHLISRLSVAKPVLDLLTERLEASQKTQYHNPLPANSYSDFTKLKPSSQTSISDLIDHHGWFETAVLYATVENMACLCFLWQYGARGAIERTLPVLCERASDTFGYAYGCLVDKSSVFSDSPVQSHNRRSPPGKPNDTFSSVVFAIQGVILFLLAALDTQLRFLVGKDYLTVGADRLQEHLVRTAACVRLKLSRASAMITQLQSSSHAIAFLIDRLMLLACIFIISCSILFAFLSVYIIRQPTEELGTKGSNRSDIVEGTLPTSLVLRTSDWRTSGIQVIGFRESANVYPIIEEEAFNDLEIEVQIEGPSSSESEEDVGDTSIIGSHSSTPFGSGHIPTELKGKMKEALGGQDLTNSPTALAGRVSFIGSADTPEVEDVFIGLREYYEECKRHYGTLSCPSSFSGSEPLSMTTSLTFEHISSDNLAIGNERRFLGFMEAKTLDEELKEALDISASPVIQEHGNSASAKMPSRKKLRGKNVLAFFLQCPLSPSPFFHNNTRR
ncbi:hypothetical protein CPB84DRAFT_1744766 [Gymnopilus junonius]|uniref:Uncharacterized protein n=1 Tax=Gymnopilus junonius TaxID=109634 RepID=A0A9P5NWR5_GYMJU|nr:hypothetical protein CPB84DRAFT_1744766 [Gymnopilus junonius]